MLQQKTPLTIRIQVSALQFLTTELTNERLFNVNCQLGDMSQRRQHTTCVQHQHARPYSCWLTPLERYTQTKCALIYSVAQKSKLLYCVNSLLFLSHPVHCVSEKNVVSNFFAITSSTVNRFGKFCTIRNGNKLSIK